MKNGIEIKSVSPVFRQQLSHQLIEGRFTNLNIRYKAKSPGNIIWVNKTEIKNYAFPRFISQYLQKLEI